VIRGDDIRRAFEEVDAFGWEHAGDLKPWLAAHGIDGDEALLVAIDVAEDIGAATPFCAALPAAVIYTRGVGASRAARAEPACRRRGRPVSASRRRRLIGSADLRAVVADLIAPVARRTIMRELAAERCDPGTALSSARHFLRGASLANPEEAITWLLLGLVAGLRLAPSRPRRQPIPSQALERAIDEDSAIGGEHGADPFVWLPLVGIAAHDALGTAGLLAGENGASAPNEAGVCFLRGVRLGLRAAALSHRDLELQGRHPPEPTR
jgi:hypothetical protein